MTKIEYGYINVNGYKLSTSEVDRYNQMQREVDHNRATHSNLDYAELLKNHMFGIMNKTRGQYD